MEIDDANELVIQEALRRLGPNTRLDPNLLQETIAEVVNEQGEVIFSQFSESAREQLRREGLKISEQTEHLERITQAIEYGRSLIAKYSVESLGELPQEEQLEFARLWMAATGGAKPLEN
jgi:hypothetical protein